MRETRSSALSSKLNAVSRYGYCCALINPAVNTASITDSLFFILLPACCGPKHMYYLTPNLKTVLDRNGSTGVRMTDGNAAWFGLSGKCWVSRQNPERYW